MNFVVRRVSLLYKCRRCFSGKHNVRSVCKFQFCCSRVPMPFVFLYRHAIIELCICRSEVHMPFGRNSCPGWVKVQQQWRQIEELLAMPEISWRLQYAPREVLKPLNWYRRYFPWIYIACKLSQKMANFFFCKCAYVRMRCLHTLRLSCK